MQQTPSLGDSVLWTRVQRKREDRYWFFWTISIFYCYQAQNINSKYNSKVVGTEEHQASYIKEKHEESPKQVCVNKGEMWRCVLKELCLFCWKLKHSHSIQMCFEDQRAYFTISTHVVHILTCSHENFLPPRQDFPLVSILPGHTK